MSRPPDRAAQPGSPTPTTEAASVRATRVLSLATATRDYARALESGTFDRLPASDLRCLFEAMGADLWAWQYARRLTGQSPWRARSGIDERTERSLAERAVMEGIDTWSAALTALDARVEQARLHRQPMPEPLAVPADIRAALEARRAAALERIARRRGRAGDGGTDAEDIPDAGVHHPPYPGRPA